MGKMEFPPETSILSHSRPFWQKNRSPAAQQGECDKFLVCDEKQMVLDPWGRPKGATHTVLFSHSRKLAHSRGGIVLYRWNYFARKKTGSSMICVPRFCVQSSLRGHKDVKKDGESLWIGFWDPEKCRRQIPIRTLSIHFWKAQHYYDISRKLLKVTIFFGEEHVQSTTYEKKRSTWQTVWNTNFTWKGSWQFPEISQLFWYGICSALEYGQEIARIIPIQ